MANTTKPEFDFSKAYKATFPSLVIIGIFSAFTNLLVLVVPLYMMQLFDRVIPTQNTNTLLYLTVIGVTAITVYGILEAARTICLSKAVIWFTDTLRKPILRALARQENEHLKSSVIPDLDQLRQSLMGGSVIALFDLPWMPIFVVLIWLIHPWFALLIVLTAFIMLAISYASDRLLSITQKESNADKKTVDLFEKSILENAPAIQSLRMVSAVIENWHSRHIKRTNDTNFAGFVVSATSGATKGIRMLAQILALGMGAYLVIQDQISIGVIIAISIMIARTLAPIDSLVAGFKNVRTSISILRHLRKLLATQTVQPSPKLPEFQGGISVQSAAVFDQKTRRPMLSNISLDLKPSEILVISGPSGSGKSILCQALAGYRKPNGGTIRLDGINIEDWTDPLLENQIGYLPQKVQFLPGTLGENICRFQAADFKDIAEAAKLAGIHDLIESLPRRYDTIITADGAPLSKGQQQQLGLARAIYRKPRLLILDEPHLSMDSDASTAFLAALRAANGWGATLVIVAHVAAMLRSADKVLQLNKGTIENYGPPDLVFKKQSLEEAGQSNSLGASS